MFTIDELSIIKMYSGFQATRDELIAAMKESLSLIEEPEIVETVKSTIRKAKAMTKEAFEAIDLIDILEEEPTL